MMVVIKVDMKQWKLKLCFHFVFVIRLFLQNDKYSIYNRL